MLSKSTNCVICKAAAVATDGETKFHGAFAIANSFAMERSRYALPYARLVDKVAQGSYISTKERVVEEGSLRNPPTALEASQITR